MARMLELLTTCKQGGVQTFTIEGVVGGRAVADCDKCHAPCPIRIERRRVLWNLNPSYRAIIVDVCNGEEVRSVEDLLRSTEDTENRFWKI